MAQKALDYAGRPAFEFTERWRRRRSLQWYLIGLAFALLGVSLPLPAFLLDPWVSGNKIPQQGWLCLVVGLPFYPSNLYLLLSPLWSVIILYGRSDKGQAIIVALSTFSTIAVLWLFVQSFADFRIGGYLWVAAHCVTTLSYCIIVPRLNPENG